MRDQLVNYKSLVIRVLEALKQASKDLQIDLHNNTPTKSSSATAAASADCDSPSVNALLELETESDDLFSGDPKLSPLSRHLSRLKSLIEDLRLHRHDLLLRRRRQISRVAGSIESEIQAWIDRESLGGLVHALRNHDDDDPSAAIDLLSALQHRLSRGGFDRDLQDLVLDAGVLPAVDSVVRDARAPVRVREACAEAVAALVRFNKDVFLVPPMGPTARALVSMASARALAALTSLIVSVKSPLVDEIRSNGDVAKIVGLLGPGEDLEIRARASECVMEMGYYGRKEAVEAMMGAGVVERMVGMERGGDGGFGGCVGRFAVQLEVGEGLRGKERRAFKVEILRAVREAVSTDDEDDQALCATIIAEVLWGSTPY
ncbi:hypothetical protein QJS04_geneDACA006438 [Acorus gramineus]|uniref:Uncharacterized protein n=1 Tax=Acorus gramineus TaxID=55184 RepID=A0AAV9AXA7_ACOGR|nr:hypothetical protein QJS04_geneDACA006438 [Acorus gramineus]